MMAFKFSISKIKLMSFHLITLWFSIFKRTLSESCSYALTVLEKTSKINETVEI